MKTTILKLGFAAAIFAFGTAESCNGGDVNQADGTCPLDEICSPATPDGLVFLAPVIGEVLFDDGELKPIATGGTQRVQLLAGTDESPLALAFAASVSDDAVSVAATSGNRLTLRAGSAEGTGELRVTDPATDELFDRTAVSAIPLADASLTESLNEQAADLDDGLPMLFAPGGLGAVGLHGDGVALIDDSMTIRGAAVRQVAWDRFVVGEVAPGSYALVATSTGQVFTLAFDVAAAPDRVAPSFAQGSDDESVVGDAGLACFSAFLGARYMHASWTYSADNASVAPSAFEGCAEFTPLAVGPLAIHATAAGLTAEITTTVVAPPDHTRARAQPIGSRGERATATAR